MISPLIFYSYRYGGFPEGKIWETFLFTYESLYYKSVSTFVWVFQGKFIPLYLLCIWYFTCRYWWNFAILVPIGMYVFQMISLFNDEMKFKDEIEIYYIIPIMLIVAFILSQIRKRIQLLIKAFDLQIQLDEEAEKVKQEVL